MWVLRVRRICTILYESGETTKPVPNKPLLEVLQHLLRVRDIAYKSPKISVILEEAKVGAGSGGWRWVRRMALGKGGHVLQTSKWGDAVDCPGDIYIYVQFYFIIIICPSRRCFSARDRGVGLCCIAVMSLQACRGSVVDLYRRPPSCKVVIWN